jgi:hypothetical protein
MVQENIKNRSELLQRVRVAEQLQAAPIPIWDRMTGAARLTGLSRTRLFELKALGKIKCRHIKAPGKTKGIVLINIPSLLQYIEEIGE